MNSMLELVERYKLCFTLYAGLAIFILIRTLFLLPTTQIPYERENIHEVLYISHVSLSYSHGHYGIRLKYKVHM